jgi:hypothetical protein
MYTTDAPLVFTPDASTVFVIVFSILLIIAWIALLLWVRSVISRDSIQNEPEDHRIGHPRTIATTITTPSFTHHFTFVAVATSPRIFIM